MGWVFDKSASTAAAAWGPNWLQDPTAVTAVGLQSSASSCPGQAQMKSASKPKQARSKFRFPTLDPHFKKGLASCHQQAAASQTPLARPERRSWRAWTRCLGFLLSSQRKPGHNLRSLQQSNLNGATTTKRTIRIAGFEANPITRRENKMSAAQVTPLPCTMHSEFEALTTTLQLS